MGTTAPSRWAGTTSGWTGRTNIHIGDRIYRGADADMIRSVLADIEPMGRGSLRGVSGFVITVGMLIALTPVSLSTGLTALLAPLLPYLTGLGKAAGGVAADQLGRRLGEAVMQRATALWDRLWPRLRDQPPARQAVTTVAADPDAPEARGALAEQIATLLAEDPELAQEAAALVRQAGRPGVAIEVDALTVTGDRNTVQVGEQNISIGQAHDVHITERRPQG